MSIPVHLDCQLHPNIDDAFALALALSAPEINLVGVTTVADMDGQDAQIAQRLIQAYGFSEIGAHAGVNASSKGLSIRRCAAVQFIIEQVRQFYGELVIITTGPMTNLALALRQAPDIASGSERMYHMSPISYTQRQTTPGGYLATPSGDANAEPTITLTPTELD